jgi:hypothetical protein
MFVLPSEFFFLLRIHPSNSILTSMLYMIGVLVFSRVKARSFVWTQNAIILIASALVIFLVDQTGPMLSYLIPFHLISLDLTISFTFLVKFLKKEMKERKKRGKTCNIERANK